MRDMQASRGQSSMRSKIYEVPLAGIIRSPVSKGMIWILKYRSVSQTELSRDAIF